MSKPIQPIICMNVPNVSIAHLLPFIKPCGVIVSVKKTALKHPKACPVKRDRFRRFQVCFRKRNRPLVFLDECGMRKDWIRRYGYAPIGQRCYSEHDWHGKNQVNTIGAVCENRLFTVGLFNHSIDKEAFKSWLEQLLIPALPKNSVVVMDNAAFCLGFV